jgi:predicted house-cleaning noncanonical NTP pyrophosphatase (MazG superfamily)
MMGEAKLVRDRIPDLIRAEGGTRTVETLGADDYRAALRAQLVEEAGEAAAARGDEALTEELADVLEVVDALLAAHGLDAATVREVQARKRAARGGFARRLHLHAVEGPR